MARQRKATRKKTNTFNYNLIFGILIVGTIVALWILTSPMPTASVSY
jgi:hypothetical protein